MKKHLRLMLALLTLTLGWTNASAQTWTASEVSTGDFVLYNVGTGQYFTKGNGWGTQASITTNANPSSAMTLTLTAFNDNYKLGNGSYGVEYLNSGTIYTDQSRDKNSTWTFTQVGTDNGPVYNIISAENHGGGPGTYMTAEGGSSTIVGPGTDGTIANAQWKLLASAKVPLLGAMADYAAVKAAVEALDDDATIYSGSATIDLSEQDAAVAAATTTNEIYAAIDAARAIAATFISSVSINDGKSFNVTIPFIKNPSPYANGTDWVLSADATFDSGNQCAEYWNKSGATIKQTISTELPAGYYTLTAQAFTRTDMVATLSAGDNSTNIITVPSSQIDNRSEAKTWFDGGNGMNALTFQLADATTNLVIGLTAATNKSDYWMVWRGFKLEYLGTAPLLIFQNELASAVSTARTHANSLVIPAAALTAYNNAIDAAAANNATIADCQAGVAAIEAATSTADALVAPYAAYKVAAEDAGIAGVAAATISAQNTAVEDATTVAAVEACTSALRTAIATITSFDITTFTITNPEPYANGDDWTATNGNRLNDWASNPVTYDSGNKCAEMWANTGATMLYTITNLPAGNYRLTAIAGARDNSGGVLKVGDKTVELVSVGSVNSRSGAKTWFDNGNGVNELFFTLDDTAAELTIGLVAGTSGDAWTLWRSFKLETFDESVAASYLAPGYAELVAAAQATLNDAAYVNVTGNEKTALETAIAATPSTIAEYEAAVEALNTAVAAFTAAKTNYDLYVSELAIAQAISTTITVTAPTTSEEALAAFKTLKVTEYNFVATEYPYSATSKIGEFSTWTRTGTVNGQVKNEFEALTSQHWSGTAMTYYEQPAGGWGANAWTANYTKTTTLPAGNYVVKVAARAATGTGTTAKITCSVATLEGPIFNFGDTGKGITTDGVASFDEGTFANDGNGRGWVWNYLPFTLTEETEVTMTVVAEATGTRQWFSVADGELLSKENIATAVAYNDAVTNTIEDVDVANVTMTRTIKEGYNTVCLPFDLTASQVQAAFGTGAEVYTFEDVADGTNSQINFNKVVAGTISANVPVLVKATVASSVQIFNGVQVVAASEAKVEGTNFDFVGIYAPLAVIPESDYFISGGKLYKSKGTTSMKAFRAYIKAKTAGANVKMFINDEGVDAISLINDEPATGDAIYNIIGQRVNKAQKGIYIVNGKKVLVK